MSKVLTSSDTKTQAINPDTEEQKVPQDPMQDWKDLDEGTITAEKKTLKKKSTLKKSLKKEPVKEAAEKEEEDGTAEEEFDPILQVTDVSVMRSQLSFVIGNVKNGITIVLIAYGINIPKAIRMADIVKLRISDVHQINDFRTSKCK